LARLLGEKPFRAKMAIKSTKINVLMLWELLNPMCRRSEVLGEEEMGPTAVQYLPRDKQGFKETWRNWGLCEVCLRGQASESLKLNM